MSGAVFNTITGADWARNLPACRIRRTRHAIEIADIRRRASEARAGYQNTLAVGLADGAQGDPATGFCIVPHETTQPTAFNFPTMTGGTASQIQDNARKAAETPEALRESL